MKIPASLGGPLINIPVGSVGSRGTVLTWLVDSGAGENVIDEMSFKENYADVRLSDLPPDLVFKTADGSPLRVIGYCTLQFQFGDTIREGNVYVCKGVTRTRLIGSKLLSTFRHWGIDNREGIFVVDGESVPLHHTVDGAPKVCKVTVKEDVEIPPRCSRLIKGGLPYHYQPAEFLFTPDDQLTQKSGVCVPTCLVANDVFDGSVIVRVTNVDTETKTLTKGTKLGEVKRDLHEYIIQAEKQDTGVRVCSVRQETEGLSEQEMLSKLKDSHIELYELYNKSCSLLGKDDRLRLLRLLFRYQGNYVIQIGNLPGGR